MQQAASPLRLYFILYTSYFILHTSYFISPFVAWWRRSTMQQAASPLRLYFILYTSYFILQEETPPSCRRLAWRG